MIKDTQLKAGQLVKKFSTGEMFGLIECDIEVARWNQVLINYFEEFSPICKNVEISIDDIGPHMRHHAEEFGLMKKPRKT